MDKKVSIITPCYNGEKFVGRFLNSILNQTYDNMEMIFINDGSTDKTEIIIEDFIPKFKERGIDFIYIYQENLGQAAALNNGLKVITGEYLTWPDSDDILSKDSIRKKVEFLQKNPLYGMVRSDARLVNENNINNTIGYFAKNNLNKYKEELFLDFIIQNNVWFAPGCFMIRISYFLEANGGNEIYSGRGGQNWQMLLPITYKYKCGFIDECLYTYVVRKSSHSNNTITLEKQINRYGQHENILINTINNINMTNREKDKYVDIIKEKYIRRKFNLAVSYNNKALAKRFYSELKNNYKVTVKERIKYLSTRNRVLNIGIRRIKEVLQND